MFPLVVFSWSFWNVIPGCAEGADPESRGYQLQIPGSRSARAGMT
jgi:hypothetical protein